MQLLAIVAFMVVLPILSVGVDVLVRHAPLVAAVGQWFVFWGIGLRLGTAAIRQIVQPAYTARDIFEIEDPKAGKIVTELGFENLAIAAVAVLSVYFTAWVPAAALAGAIFYGLAGIQHIRNGTMTRPERLAMLSDCFMAVVLLAYLLAAAFLR
jgi:hypothetical protein